MFYFTFIFPISHQILKKQNKKMTVLKAFIIDIFLKKQVRNMTSSHFVAHLTTKIDRCQYGSEHLSVLDQFIRILDETLLKWTIMLEV